MKYVPLWWKLAALNIYRFLRKANMFEKMLALKKKIKHKN